MSQFGAPQASGLEHHQKNAVEHRRSGIDEPRHLFRAQDLRKAESLTRIGCFRNRPGSPQRRHEEEPKGSRSLNHGIWCQFSHPEQIGLVLPKLVWTELIGGTFEITRQLFDRFDMARTVL